MSHPESLSQWETLVSTHLPHLSRPQARVLALWSYGMVLAKSCGITSVVAILAPLLKQSESTLRQRLREWCYPREHKKGTQRQALEVSSCFAPLLGWVLSWWDPGEHRLALAMDGSHALRSLHGAGDQCALSRLRYPGGLENRAQQCARLVGAVLDGALEPFGQSGAARLDGHRVGRSRLVCQVVVRAYRAPQVASVLAHQSHRQGATGGGKSLSLALQPGS